MPVVTVRKQNPSGLSRSILANLPARLGLVKRACLAAARYIDVDHEQRPDFLLRSMVSRDLVREAMVNSGLHPCRQQDPNGGDLPFQRKRLPGHRSVLDPPFRTPFPRLAFEDSLTALDYACDGECLLHEGVMLPALILEVRESFGAVAAAGVQGKRRQTASVRVASADGGFIVSASTSGSQGPRLQPGHFVAWQAGRYDRQVAGEEAAR